MDKKDLLLVIDSNSLIHRAYHALPPLTLKNGETIHAVYGFFSMFLKAVSDYSPMYIAPCFDVAGKNFRHAKYEAYKAHRKRAPDDLYKQIEVVKDVLNCFGIKSFFKTGFEADDLIASIVKKATSQVNKIVILSGDLDNTQLINDQVSVCGLGKGFKETVIFDAKATQEHFGVRPDQVVDYKSLAGDSSDNIPGGKGIGPKLAITLLEQYGHVPDLFDQIEKGLAWDLNEKTKDLLLNNKEIILLSYQLAKANDQALEDFDLKTCAWDKYDKSLVEKKFKELLFFSLVNRLP